MLKEILTSKLWFYGDTYNNPCWIKQTNKKNHKIQLPMGIQWMCQTKYLRVSCDFMDTLAINHIWRTKNDKTSTHWNTIINTLSGEQHGRYFADISNLNLNLKKHFLKWNCLNVDPNFTETCTECCNYQIISIGFYGVSNPGYGMAQNRWQAMTRISVYWVSWCHMASLGQNKVRSWCAHYNVLKDLHHFQISRLMRKNLFEIF